MYEATQPREARRKMLPVAVVATALLALHAFAPLASAAPDPVASGSTTVTLNQKLAKQLRQLGIKLSAIKPAKVKGAKATLPVTGGSFDPTTKAGTLIHAGGLKFKWGKKSVQIKALEVNTSKKALIGKVGGKKMTVAKLAGVTYTREGFGVKAKIKKLKLTGNAAVTLDKKLAPAPPKSKHKKGKKGGNNASKSEAIPAVFKANALLGSATSSEQPATATLLPTGSMVVDLDSGLAKKLSEAKVEIQPQSAIVSGTSYNFGISGGTVSPLGTGGTVQTGGGLKLVQRLPKNIQKTEFLETEITLGSFWEDLSAKTVSVEVTAHSNVEEGGKKPLDLGALGRSSVANITVGTVANEPVSRTVSVQNSAAVLQPVSAEVLNSFVKVYAGFLKESLQIPKMFGGPELTKAEAEAKAAEFAKANEITSSNALGSVSFTGVSQ